MVRLVNVNDDRVSRDPGASSRISCVCCICGKIGATLADLDGPPFKAYYHSTCLPDDGRDWDGALPLD